jgi:uncharacterized protein (TIGR03067 family)
LLTPPASIASLRFGLLNPSLTLRVASTMGCVFVWQQSLRRGKIAGHTNRRFAMRIHGLVLAAASMLAMVVGAADNKTLKSDKEKLQGKWQIMSIATEDKVIKREDKPAAWKGAFEKDLFVEGDRFGQVGYSNTKIKVDDTRDPKQITIHDDQGKLTYRGIYALNGDMLTVCVNGDGSDVRCPKEFATKKGTPLIVVTLKRRPAEK